MIGAPPKPRRVLLVGWDAADWKVISPLVDGGHMPYLAGLIQRGVMGNLATIQPMLSPMLWTSIATGKRPYKHGIHGFSEPDSHTGTLRPITNLSRTTRALWNILHHQGKTSHVVGWWPSHPAEPIRGSMVSNHFQQAVAPLEKPWPMRTGTVHPPELAGELAEMRLHPHELEGDMLRHFVPRAPELDQEKDQRLHMMAKILAESASIHAAATHLIETRPDWDFAAVYHDAIDHFCHGFMRYHPPRLDWVSEEDFALYHGVIRAGYVWHDMMLGRLLQLAGPETTVIVMSDHGFHPDHLRPRSVPNEPAGPAAEHRAFGIFVAAGPGIRQDEVIFGASILDVAPTILSLFGLPIGRDMDGHVLTQIHQAAVKPAYIDSWDAEAGEDGRHPPETRISAVDSEEAIKQLVALGYIEQPDPDSAKAHAETVRELEYNLARAYLDGGLADDAAALFHELWERWPEESRFGVHLLQAQLQNGQPLEARETMTRLRERKKSASDTAAQQWRGKQQTYLKVQLADGSALPAQTPGGEPRISFEALPEAERRGLLKLRARAATNLTTFAYLEGQLLALEGRDAEALESFRVALSTQQSNRPTVLWEIGECHLRRREWPAAERSFEEVLALDPLNPQARYGLARLAMAQKDFPRAVAEIFACLGQRFHHPQAHYLAARALWRAGRLGEVEASLLHALTQNPVFPAAHALMAHYCRTVARDYVRAFEHRRLATESIRRIRHRCAGLVPAGQHPLEQVYALCQKPDLPAPPLPPREECITVVSGLPRSGTSMMMQMLAAGGVPVLADDQRAADESNPRGYWEFALAKNLAREATWLEAAKGKAVKLIAQLLPHLPSTARYRVIMMHRPLAEVTASQRQMLQRLGREGAKITGEALMETFGRQMTQVATLLAHHQRQGLVDVLHVQYHDALRTPAETAARLAEFLGGAFAADKAAAVVDATLWRERASG